VFSFDTPVSKEQIFLFIYRVECKKVMYCNCLERNICVYTPFVKHCNMV
jgi:hypothetical protein